jgi:hypothetical protein
MAGPVAAGLSVNVGAIIVWCGIEDDDDDDDVKGGIIISI